MPTAEEFLGPPPTETPEPEARIKAEDFLGPRIRATDFLGPRPASQYERETFGQPIADTSPEGNLARAARDWQTQNERFPAHVAAPDVTFQPGVLAGGVSD